ncbi:MAG: tetratricopeptide repeat protein [Thermodesulfobacteriota bacterium]
MRGLCLALAASLILALLAVSPAWAQEVDLGVITVKQKANAESIRQRLVKGESFEALAKQYSVGPTASRGGRLGRVPETRLRAEYKQALAGLRPGQPSPVVPTEEGYNILMRFDQAAASATAPPAQPAPRAAAPAAPLAPRPSAGAPAAPARPAGPPDSPQLVARQQVMAALERLAAGQPKEAEADLSKALGFNPREDSALFLLEIVRASLAGQLQAKAVSAFAQGFIAMFNGSEAEALTLFRQARQTDGRLWQATLFEANVLAGTGQSQAAAELLQRLIKEHPKAARAFLSLGLIALDARRVDEAVNRFEHALNLEPELAEAHYRLGNLQLAKGDLVKAESELKAAIASDPYKEEAYNDLGLVMAMTGRTGEAEQLYAKALQLNPAYVAVHVNLGTLLAQTGRVSQAIDEFNKALAIDPGLADAHINLAVAYVMREEWPQAVRHAEMAEQMGAQVPQIIKDKLAPHRK